MSMQNQSSTGGRNIYLAGKIRPWGNGGQEDWRFTLVPELAHTVSPEWMGAYISVHDEWFILPKAILRQFNYVGPFFTDLSDVYGGHGGGKAFAHGIYADRRPGESHQGYTETMRDMVTVLCCKALRRADLVFAWIDSVDCYGTLFELGYAKALGKPIAAYFLEKAFREEPLHDHGNPFAELWFAMHACDWQSASDPAAAFHDAIYRRGWLWLQERYDSPLESAFAHEWVNQALHLLYPLSTQHPVKDGRYRIDFAFAPLQVGIELDGHTYHSNREAFTKDRQRQREIEGHGWRIIRFSGDELRQNITRCVQEASHFLSVEQHRKETP